ncbi:CAAX farnesyltransferase (FTase) subunit beta [Dimargaris xerosporica]|nr:CAAX farnesyltransferase (FTase) subunit beta [Dimargaris xerosporica]
MMLPAFTTDDGYPTPTSQSQRQVEEDIGRHFAHTLADELDTVDASQDVTAKKGLRTTANLTLNRSGHVHYLNKILDGVSGAMQGLDAGRPWFSYWTLTSLDILGAEIAYNTQARTISTLSAWQRPDGGYGGPDQLAHLAATYAAVLALTVIGTPEAYDSINRDQLYKFLMRMKQPDGSFTAHDGGEIDVRGSYCVMVVAALTNLLTEELCENVAEYIVSCQTYEGGIASHPGVEAHGGYTYCGLAALEIIGKSDQLNIPALLSWAVSRQMAFEGGFQGRTNKLVDGCYTFWLGAIFPMLEAVLRRQYAANHLQNASDSDDQETAYINDQMEYLYDRERLQQYVLACCQGPKGGLRDKPERHPDPYHTLYVLTGLSLSQNHVIDDSLLMTMADHIAASEPETTDEASPLLSCTFHALKTLKWTVDIVDQCVVGKAENLLRATHPIYNVPLNKVVQVFKYFYGDKVKPFL